MSRIAFLIVMLAAAAGCASTSTPRAAAAPVVQSADVACDPSWNPPSEMEMSIGETHAPREAKPEMVDPVRIPKQEKPRGVVHAATY